jgi:hypothetical protein
MLNILISHSSRDGEIALRGIKESWARTESSFL